MVANSTRPTSIMTSMCWPMTASPSASVGSAGGEPSRSGQGTTRIPTASSRNTMTDTTREPTLLCSIVIGISPAGFIMYMIMKTAMTIISMTIMRTTSTPRQDSPSSRIATPVTRKEASTVKVARAVEPTTKPAVPDATAPTAQTANTTVSAIPLLLTHQHVHSDHEHLQQSHRDEYHPAHLSEPVHAHSGQPVP